MLKNNAIRVLTSVIAIFIAFTGVSCNTDKPSDTNFSGKRILYINSYHKGYEWSDGIESAIREVIAKTDAELKVIYMDSKRHRSEAQKQRAGLQAKVEIETFEPDIVIASDDNASKYVIKPYYRDAKLPFVFCGINWDISVYGYPYENVTGMIEVELIYSLLKELKQYAKGNKLGYISVNSLTDRKVVINQAAYLGRPFDKMYFVENFDEWKADFIKAQQEVDILLVGVPEAIEGWDSELAKQFVLEQTRIPTGAIQKWIVDFALFGIVKVPEEQGRWSAETALKILDGTSPADIPIVRNQESKVIFNEKLAEKLHIQFSPDILAVAEKR